MLNSFKSSVNELKSDCQLPNSSLTKNISFSSSIPNNECDTILPCKDIYTHFENYYEQNFEGLGENKREIFKDEYSNENILSEEEFPYCTLYSGIFQGGSLNLNCTNGLIYDCSQEINNTFKCINDGSKSNICNQFSINDKALYLPKNTDHCFKNMFSHSNESDCHNHHENSYQSNNVFGFGISFTNPQFTASHNNTQFDTTTSTIDSADNTSFSVDNSKDFCDNQLNSNNDPNFDELSLTEELNMIKSTSQENLNQLASHYGTERVDITSELKNKLRNNISHPQSTSDFSIFDKNNVSHDLISTNINRLMDDDKDYEFEWDEGVEDPTDAEVEEILENYASQKDCNMDSDTLTKYDERIEINEDTNVAVIKNIGAVFIKSGTSNVKFKTTKLKEICDNVLRHKMFEKNNEDDKMDSIGNFESIVDDWVEISESLKQNLSQPMESDNLPERSVLSDIEMLLDEPVSKKAISQGSNLNYRKCLLINCHTLMSYVTYLKNNEVGILDKVVLKDDYYMLIFNKEKEAIGVRRGAQKRGLYAETYEDIKNNPYDQAKKNYWNHPDVLKWL
uniref:Clathrin_bdg domain-containing protein n=1 Tax=Strongyloides venezuelensis TaxID=75913 RepID=A0A0K0EXG1_STRVS